jgi:hypothetical protein
MQLLRFRRLGDGTIRIAVWLDDSKSIDDQPDPRWVLEHNWPPRTSLPGPPAAADYQAMIRQEMRLLAQQRLASLQQPEAGTALPGEGDTL